MAGKDKVKKLREQSRFAAMEGLRPKSGWAVPPRKAMAQAKKASKDLAYPLAPYPTANRMQLLRWAQTEWRSLGPWQGLALPFLIVTALRTWEKEKAIQEVRQFDLDKADTQLFAAHLYGAYGRPKPKRKLLDL